MLASTGSARSTDVTSSTTVAPAGMTAPLVPTVAEETVALNLSPTSAEVQVRSFIVMPTRVPAPMTPAAGAGAGAGADSGARATGAGSGVVGRGVLATGAGGDWRRGVGVGRRVRAGGGASAAGARRRPRSVTAEGRIVEHGLRRHLLLRQRDVARERGIGGGGAVGAAAVSARGEQRERHDDGGEAREGAHGGEWCGTSGRTLLRLACAGAGRCAFNEPPRPLSARSAPGNSSVCGSSGSSRARTRAAMASIAAGSATRS